MRFFPLLVVASLLCCCASSSEKPASRKFKGGYRYLVDINREDGTHWPSSLYFFNCTEAELAELLHAQLFIQRIGEGPTTEKAHRVVKLRERTSSRLLKELTDYGNYMDRSACRFERWFVSLRRLEKGNTSLRSASAARTLRLSCRRVK